jgi:hypothetical protein
MTAFSLTTKLTAVIIATSEQCCPRSLPDEPSSTGDQARSLIDIEWYLLAPLAPLLTRIHRDFYRTASRQ